MTKCKMQKKNHPKLVKNKPFSLEQVLKSPCSTTKGEFDGRSRYPMESKQSVFLSTFLLIKQLTEAGAFISGINFSSTEPDFTFLSSVRCNKMFLVVRNLRALYYFQFIFLAAQGGEYAGLRSQRGYALLNTSYSTKFTQSYPDCVTLCFYVSR